MTDTVIEIRKTRGCALVLLASGDCLRVPLPLLRERRLGAGDAVDAAAYRDFMARRGYPHALDHAVRLLAARDRSTGEIAEALRAAGYADAVTRRVVGHLTEAALLDDAAFAGRWAQSRQRKRGKALLLRELAQKGIAPEDAQAALAAIDDEAQLQSAIQIARKALLHAKDGDARGQYRRLTALLARRGFSADVARRAIAAAKPPDELGV